MQKNQVQKIPTRTADNGNETVLDMLNKWRAIPFYDQSSEPDDIDGIELSCVIMKRAMLAAFSDAESDPEAAIIDLLVDIRHLCDALGVSFELKDAMASQHYMEEIQENHQEAI